MLRYSLITILVVFFGSMWIASIISCTKDKTLVNTGTLCDTAAINYTGHIEPILLANCVACHSSSNPKLTTYEQVVDAAKNANLYCSINASGSCQAMPPSGKMSDSVLKLFDTWKCKNYPK